MRVRVDIVRQSDIRPDTVSVSTDVVGSVSDTVRRIVESVGVNTRTHDVVVSVVR